MAKDKSDWFATATATRANELYKLWDEGNRYQVVVMFLEMRAGIGEGFAMATLARFIMMLATNLGGRVEVETFRAIVEQEAGDR